MKFINETTIKLDKVKTALDGFAFSFCKILEKHAKYVIVSGYVSILFGRARATEDIDVFIEELDQPRFSALFKELAKHSFECITGGMQTAFDNLRDSIPIRFAKKGTFIPNIELKFAKNPLEKNSLIHNLKIKTPFGRIFISSIEQQIAFKKICLGSEKDLEDALHLEKVFKGRLDERKIKLFEHIFQHELR